MLANKINAATFPRINYNSKLDENISKSLIQRNIFYTDPNKRIKLIVYFNELENLDINNDSSPSIRVLQNINIFLSFKYLLGYYITENNYIYFGLTSTTLSIRLSIRLSDITSRAQDLKAFMT